MTKNGYPVLSWAITGKNRFVDFWAGTYHDPREETYANCIGDLGMMAVKSLYAWKRGHGRFRDIPERQRGSIERNFLKRLPELRRLHRNCGPRDFLDRFSEGGAIYRIFLLHIWQPRKYPMYDQNVHRAMHFIKHGEPGELPKTHKARVQTYVERYLPFHNSFPTRRNREVDKALFSLGQFLKTRFGGHP